MSDPVFKTAWRRDDPQLEADAKEFWGRLNLVPPEGRDKRAKELVVVTYVDGQVVAVATAEYAMLPSLRARFAFCRTAVDPAHRQQSLSGRTFGHLRTVLETWSAEHPEEEVMGMAAIIQAAEYAEKQRDPLWPDYALFLSVVGYTARDDQIRVAWFRHARV